MAQGRAGGVVGGGACGGAAHVEVHRPGVHGQRRGGQRGRQPVLHTAGTFSDPQCRGGVHGFRAEADQQTMVAMATSPRWRSPRRATTSTPRTTTGLGLGLSRTSPTSSVHPEHGGGSPYWPLQGYVISNQCSIFELQSPSSYRLAGSWRPWHLEV